MSSGVRSWGTSLLSDGLIRAGRRYASIVGAEGGVVAQGGPTVPSGGGGGTVSSRRLQTATTPLAPTPQPKLAPPADAASRARPARRNRKSGEGASSSHATTWLKGEGEADPQDSLLFKHLHTHHDPASGRLTYYEYHARRHAHVVMLDELGVLACEVVSHHGEASVLKLAANAGKVALANLTVGSIAVSSRLNCSTSAITKDWDPLFRGRVVAPPVMETAQLEDDDKGGMMLVTLHTVSAGFHECFEHADIEYYAGSPSGLSVARTARVLS